MRITFAIALALINIIVSGNAGAFSSDGHQTVGIIADVLLHGSRAESEVNAILGKAGGQQLTLEQVSVWPDCVRGIHPSQDFKYDPGKYREAACAIFEDDAGVNEMADYAKRNNTNCTYSGKALECHKSFHFADVSIDHNRYSDTYVGTNNHDVVHAINAAIAVLNGEPAPAPFHIASKKEALMLLTHLIGDLHQPLHVGAVYLGADGTPVDPNGASSAEETDTRGGNSITGTGGNLHHQWDSTKFLSNNTIIDGLVVNARNVPGTPGAYQTWATTWASETIGVAQSAFRGLKFDAEVDKTWPMTFEDRRAYLSQMGRIQEQQVTKGGARLAALLRALWPD